MSTTNTIIQITGDTIAYTIAIGALLNWLPPLAAAVSILWVAFQFYNHPVITQWRTRRKKEDHGPI